MCQYLVRTEMLEMNEQRLEGIFLMLQISRVRFGLYLSHKGSPSSRAYKYVHYVYSVSRARREAPAIPLLLDLVRPASFDFSWI